MKRMPNVKPEEFGSRKPSHPNTVGQEDGIGASKLTRDDAGVARNGTADFRKDR